MYKLALKNHDYTAFIYLGLLYADIGDISLAVNSFEFGIEKGYFQCFHHLGDLYFHQKSIMDLDTAEQYYTAGVKYTSSPVDKSISQEKLNILLSEREDTYYTTAGDRVESKTSHEQEEGREEREEEVDEGVVLDTMSKYNLSENEMNEILSRKVILPGFMETVSDITPLEYTRVTSEHMFRNNTQNVHDYVVSNSVLSSMKSLVENTELRIPKNEVISEIRCVMVKLEQSCDEEGVFSFTKEQRVMVSVVLDFIEQKNKKYKDTNMTLLDVLHLVWNRIHADCNERIREQLVHQLMVHLAECTEDGEIVCMTGVFTRIIDCLNGSDSESLVKIIPKYVLRQELMARAAIISKEWITGLPGELGVLFSQAVLDKQEEQKMDELTERLKHKLVNELRAEYVLSGIMDEDVLFLEIKQWISYI
jgi:hypothetical protein